MCDAAIYRLHSPGDTEVLGELLRLCGSYAKAHMLLGFDSHLHEMVIDFALLLRSLLGLLTTGTCS
jgi:hypothetical protein